MKTKTPHCLIVTALSICAVFHSETLNATSITGPILNPANGHNYFLLEESSWTDAQAEAITFSGNLATIRDAAEESWVFSTFGGFGGINRSLWIGLNDIAVEGTFVWASGEPLTYTNWLPGQPDNNPSDGPEDFVQIIATGNGFNVTPNTWNDIGNTSAGAPQLGPIFGVVEVVPQTSVPEPSGAALFIFGAALGLRLRTLRSNKRNTYQIVSKS